jgi:hypothetical protein
MNEQPEIPRPPRTALTVLLSVVLVIAGGGFRSAGAQRPETLDAWGDYVRLTEDRIEDELGAGRGFFASDFEASEPGPAERDALVRGEVVVREMKTTRADRSGIEVPAGSIHHWRGAIFIPGVTLDAVLDAVRHPEVETHRQEDVLEARVIERTPEFVHVYLKLVRSGIVDATYNTEHQAHYRRHGSTRASSRTVSLRIAELEGAGTPGEREKAPGEDRGFLWRLNSYWRYAQVDGGVRVECESLSLGRSIPFLVRPLVGPIAASVARESMERTLTAMRERFAEAGRNPPARAER